KDKDNLILENINLQNVQADEVKVSVKACGVNNKDIYIRHGVYYRTKSPPLILGSDIAGVVDEVGKEVQGLIPGDRVVVVPTLGCGVCEACVDGEENQCDQYASVLGGFAEGIVLKEKNL